MHTTKCIEMPTRQSLSRVYNRELRVFFVMGGFAENALSLNHTALTSYHGVVGHSNDGRYITLKTNV